MAAELNTIEGREQYGFLGMSTWLSTSHAASNELMNVLYFRNVEGVHAFANGKTHREAWNWFNKMTKTHPHLSISHEIYGVQKGNWENIFVNFEPTNIGDTWFMKKERDAEVEWVNPLVDASNRDVATSAARLGSKRHD